MSRVADSTTPSFNTPGIIRSQASLAIVWVFPKLFTTPLHPTRVLAGRGDDCNPHLPGTLISRYHADIRREGVISIVRDRDSTNGVHLNGLRVREAPLTVGDVLRFGEWVGIVREVVVDKDRLEGGFEELAPNLWGGIRFQGVIDVVRRVAPTSLPVLLEGETGTGKEVVARALHAWSGRKGQLVAINCAALPDGLAEAELFGYRKGAFTGASCAHLGLLRSADKGTLFLDEVIDLPAALQAKLLRALDAHEVTPLGEHRAAPFDARLVAASQLSLSAAVDDGRFRTDLFARLNGARVRLPPLRERMEDVPAVFLRFLHRYSGGEPPVVDGAVIERLCLHPWPMNVRELELTARQMLALHGHVPCLRVSHLPEQLRGMPVRSSTEQPRRTQLEMLRDQLAVHHGNVARAAAAIGISRQCAYRLVAADESIDLASMRATAREGRRS